MRCYRKIKSWLFILISIALISLFIVGCGSKGVVKTGGKGSQIHSIRGVNSPHRGVVEGYEVSVKDLTSAAEKTGIPLNCPTSINTIIGEKTEELKQDGLYVAKSNAYGAYDIINVHFSKGDLGFSFILQKEAQCPDFSQEVEMMNSHPPSTVAMPNTKCRCITINGKSGMIFPPGHVISVVKDEPMDEYIEQPGQLWWWSDGVLYKIFADNNKIDEKGIMSIGEILSK